MLSSSASITYEWKIGNDILLPITPVISVNIEGNYQVKSIATFKIAVGELKCYSNASAIFAYLKPLSTSSSLPNTNEILLFQNPSASGMITVQIPQKLVNASVLVYDISGKLLENYLFEFSETAKIVDLRNKNAQEFLIKVKANGFEQTKKVLLMN